MKQIKNIVCVRRTYNTEISELLPIHGACNTWCFHQTGDSGNRAYDDHDAIEVVSTRQ